MKTRTMAPLWVAALMGMALIFCGDTGTPAPLPPVPTQTPTPVKPVQPQNVDCTTEVRTYEEKTPPWQFWDRGYFLDVYRTDLPDGYRIFFNDFQEELRIGKDKDIASVSPHFDEGFTRFGISTKWADNDEHKNWRDSGLWQFCVPAQVAPLNVTPTLFSLPPTRTPPPPTQIPLQPSDTPVVPPAPSTSPSQPTETSVPPPSASPTSIQTPIAEVGQWEGTTNQGWAFTFDVTADGEIANLLITISTTGGLPCAPDYELSRVVVLDTTPITGDRFTYSDEGLNVSGQFTSPTEASGVFEFNAVAVIRDSDGSTGMCTAPIIHSGTWEATGP